MDVGCFPGHLSTALTKMGCEVFGISYEVEHASRVFKTPAIHSIEECKIETEPFPFDDSVSDLVIFTETIAHLPWSPLPALREIHKALKRGGYLVITSPNDSYLGRRISRIINSLLFRSGFSNLTDLKKRLELHSVYLTHHLKYTMREIKAILGWADFTIMKEEHIPCSSGFGKINIIYLPIKIFASLMARLFPQFRLYLLVIAKKP
ncbi:class I SAM-dependent methyltransferase [Chloroflexota bacterium]